MSLFIVNTRLNIQKLCKNIVLSLGIGILSTLITGRTYEIYIALEAPSFAPPAALFPIIWTVLYISIGIAAYMAESICHNQYLQSSGDPFLKMHYLQLFLSFMWFIVFFIFDSPIAALITMILLIISILLITVGFAKHNRYTLVFTVPYLLWHFYVALINIALL